MVVAGGWPVFEHIKFAPDEVSQMLGTGYLRFYSSAGVHGLAKVVGITELHILAINSNRPGTGEFRKFLALCKAECETLYIWEVWNEQLSETLRRHGFEPCTAVERGETINGMKWRRA